jgi:hypothetical protein
MFPRFVFVKENYEKVHEGLLTPGFPHVQILRVRSQHDLFGWHSDIFPRDSLVCAKAGSHGSTGTGLV